MYRRNNQLSTALIMLSAAALTLVLAVAGCTEQGQQPQKPSEGTGVAVQPSLWVDPACYVEGQLVALECNAHRAWGWCPTEDSWRHAGEPCFWVDPDGLGLMWSDGDPAADER